MTNSDQGDYPVVGNKFKITHPQVQQSGVNVYLSGLPTDVFRAAQLPLQFSNPAYSQIKWLTSFQVSKQPGKPNTGQQFDYTVEITWDNARPNNVTVYLLTDNSSTPQVVTNARPAGSNTISFPLSISDPMVGIG